MSKAGSGGPVQASARRGGTQACRKPFRSTFVRKPYERRGVCTETARAARRFCAETAARCKPALILSQAHTYEHTYLLTPLALLKAATSRRSTIAQHGNSSPNFDRSTNSDSFLTISEAFSREKEAKVVIITIPIVDRAGPLGEA